MSDTERSPGKLFAYRTRRETARAEQALARAVAEGQEHPVRARERLGHATAGRPGGPLVWLHAADDTAALDLPHLIDRLLAERDDLDFLITTRKYDPASTLEARLPDRTVHQYLPYEQGDGFQLFFAHWRPDLLVWAESEIRPHVIEIAHARDVPAFWINATMRDDRQARLRWLPNALRGALGQLGFILAADGRSAGNLRRLGVAADKLEVTGYLQEGAPPLPCSQAERDALAELLAARPVWLAAGISPEEEEAVMTAHRRASRRSHRLLLILVPDDLSRGEALAERLERAGWVTALRSTGEEPEREIQVYVADLPDEMGLWYRLAPVALMGQTLAEGIGRDPYEATALGSAVIHGPNLGAFAQGYARLASARAAREVANGDELAAELDILLAPDKAAEMARAAWEVSTSGAEVTDRVRALIFDALDERGL